MDIWYYLMTPFTWLLKMFYGLFGNSYGLAIILFALVVKLITFPLSLKGKRGMIQMNMLNGEMQKLQKRYGKDQNRYNEEVQKLYAKEGVNPMGGCLWSMLPLLILFPVYAVVRRPMKYWLGLSDTVINGVTAAVTGAGITLNRGYPEISMVSHFFQDPTTLATAQAAAGEAASSLYGINFSFLGIDLAATPQLKFWVGGISWASIGLLLIPVLTAVTAFLSSKIMMKTNQVNQQDGEDNPAAKQSKMMLWMSPLMMLYFSFVMPAAMGVYIIANSVFSVVQEIICGRMLKKDYEQAAEAARLREIEEKEEEKRLRREKAEQRAREAEEARKNKGKKREQPTGDDDKTTAEQKAASRVGMRQYARGRAYDPDRFGGVTPYHEDLAKAAVAPAEEPEETPAPVAEKPEPAASVTESSGEETAVPGGPTSSESPAEIPDAEDTLDADLEEVNAQLDAAIEDSPAEEPKED